MHYAEFGQDLLTRIKSNHLRPDLFISTTSEALAAEIEETFQDYDGGTVEVRCFANRGRDMGPFLVGFADKLRDYEFVGHLHGKRSVGLGSEMVETWREFLYGTLIGGRYRSMDEIVGALRRDPTIGLMFPEDPHIVGWQQNLAIAEPLARRLKLGELPETIEFPVGNMFFARRAALAPLFDAGFALEDFPAEPVSYDGTVLHAPSSPIVAHSPPTGPPCPVSAKHLRMRPTPPDTEENTHIAVHAPGILR